MIRAVEGEVPDCLEAHAFIGLATSHLNTSSLPAAATHYFVGTTPATGNPALGGKVPTPTDEADLAATAIGQSQVLVSPLDFAMVSAAIESGTVREPRLVVRAPDDRAPTRTLGKTLVNDLHEMMADVVASGTAANEGLPAGTYAKTGTAQYGTGTSLPTDAWLIGFNGDIAFAALVVDGGNGGPTDGPIVARFLDALGATKCTLRANEKSSHAAASDAIEIVTIHRADSCRAALRPHRVGRARVCARHSGNHLLCDSHGPEDRCVEARGAVSTDQACRVSPLPTCCW